MADNKIQTKIKAISIQEWITIITVLVTIVKAIIECIKEFEVPDATGEDKKAAVMLFVETLLNESAVFCPAIIPLKEPIMAIVSAIVNAIVKGFNLVGKFRHKATA